MEPKIEEYHNKVINLEGEISDLKFQKSYLEKAAKERNEKNQKENQELD